MGCRTRWGWGVGEKALLPRKGNLPLEKPCSPGAATQAVLPGLICPRAALIRTPDGAGPVQPRVARLAGSSCGTFGSLLPSGLLRRGFGTTPVRETRFLYRNRPLMRGDTARERAATWRRGGTEPGDSHATRSLRRLSPAPPQLARRGRCAT